MSYIAEIEANADGIPCIIRVISYEPYVPAYLGSPDGSYAAEGGVGEYVLLDENGVRDESLDELASHEAIRRIIFHYFEGGPT